MTHNHIPTVRQEVQSPIDYLHIKGTIDDKTFTFLSPNNPPRTPLFYVLPKVHKPDCLLRPIISANDSPTENISSYVNHFLQPYMKALPLFIKHTKHFFSETLNLPNLPEEAFLVTADVVSMYNNIQHIRNNKRLLPENENSPWHNTNISRHHPN